MKMEMILQKVSGDNNNLTAKERFITATPKDCDNFLLTNINKNRNMQPSENFVSFES